mmetsp:Transcript_23981/g.44314  ORF Transcript_23981/g.44314 Transcript_23981/m.44314 type:complete len:259 (+) Transcript_23981:1612-2388(+)
MEGRDRVHQRPAEHGAARGGAAGISEEDDADAHGVLPKASGGRHQGLRGNDPDGVDAGARPVPRYDSPALRLQVLRQPGCHRAAGTGTARFDRLAGQVGPHAAPLRPQQLRIETSPPSRHRHPPQGIRRRGQRLHAGGHEEQERMHPPSLPSILLQEYRSVRSRSGEGQRQRLRVRRRVLSQDGPRSSDAHQGAHAVPVLAGRTRPEQGLRPKDPERDHVQPVLRQSALHAVVRQVHHRRGILVAESEVFGLSQEARD